MTLSRTASNDGGAARDVARMSRDEPPRGRPEKPPPLDEDPGKGQFYFPGRPKGCLVLLALLACAAGAVACVR